MAEERDICATGRFALIQAPHADALVALFERNAIPAVVERFDPFPLTAARAQRIAHRSGRDLYYGLFEKGEILAFSMLRGFDEGYEIPSFGIFVDAGAQRQGIGRRLTQWTIEQAWQLDCPAVRLSVYTDNASARHIYESLGFSERERMQVKRGDRRIEKIVMLLEKGA